MLLYLVRKMDAQPQKQINDMKDILNSGGEIAVEIKTFFELNHYFTDELRLKLIRLILKDKRYRSRLTLSNMSDQICEIFPGESKVLLSCFIMSLHLSNIFS